VSRRSSSTRVERLITRSGLLALLTGPLALLFGLLTVRRGRYPTAGYAAIALGGAPLLLWWLDSLR
jgi:hypothetical protein